MMQRIWTPWVCLAAATVCAPALEARRPLPLTPEEQVAVNLARLLVPVEHRRNFDRVTAETADLVAVIRDILAEREAEAAAEEAKQAEQAGKVEQAAVVDAEIAEEVVRTGWGDGVELTEAIGFVRDVPFDGKTTQRKQKTDVPTASEQRETARDEVKRKKDLAAAEKENTQSFEAARQIAHAKEMAEKAKSRAESAYNRARRDAEEARERVAKAEHAATERLKEAAIIQKKRDSETARFKEIAERQEAELRSLRKKAAELNEKLTAEQARREDEQRNREHAANDHPHHDQDSHDHDHQDRIPPPGKSPQARKMGNHPPQGHDPFEPPSDRRLESRGFGANHPRRLEARAHEQEDREREETDRRRRAEELRREIEHVRMEMPLLEMEAERAALEGDLSSQRTEQMFARVKLVTEPEYAGIWAVERLCDIYGEDAAKELRSMVPSVRSDTVRRFIQLKLVDLARDDRKAAADPLRALIMGTKSGDARRSDPVHPSGRGKGVPPQFWKRQSQTDFDGFKKDPSVVFENPANPNPDSFEPGRALIPQMGVDVDISTSQRRGALVWDHSKGGYIPLQRNGDFDPAATIRFGEPLPEPSTFEAKPVDEVFGPAGDKPTNPPTNDLLPQ